MARSRLVLGVCLGLSLLSGAGAQAQGTATVTPHVDPHPLSEYSGVTPGGGDRPPAEGRIGRGSGRGRRAPATVATWPGFVPASGGGGTRFFVQTTAPVATTIAASPGRVEIVFPNTRTHLSNTRRWLETEFFDTPVLRARFERRRNDLVLVFFLRTALGGSSPVSAMPTVTSGTEPATGYFFTYIDFPAGRWIEEPVAPPPAPAPERGPSAGGSEPGRPPPSRADDPSLRAMDDERPPPPTRGPRP